MPLTSYLPLPTGILERGTPLPWRRRAVQSSYLLVVALSVFLLFEYASYLLGGQDDLQDIQDRPDSDDLPDFSLDAVYLPFRPPQRPSVSRELKPSTPLPASCLDAHVSKGELCYSPGQQRFDVLWTWVNGSDILLQDAKTRVEEGLPPDDPYRPNPSWKQVRQFRDHDELRYSIRSVLANFRPYIDRFHVLSSDFPIQYTGNETGPLDYRLGQVPQWLDTDSTPWTDGQVRLQTKHHAQIFQPYVDNVFNSYAIESQFGHLEDIAEHFVYLNDDFFFLRSLSPRSFYTSAYGLVLRMQVDLHVAPKQYGNNIKGEWRALAKSNNLLSNRFGIRHRPYVTHEAKAASLSLAHELSLIWSEELATAATHPFRETRGLDADPSMMFMLVHFVIERWREALLWSWVVGKHGTLEDGWTHAIMQDAWRDLGGSTPEMETETLQMEAMHRDTLDPERLEANLKASGHEQVDATSYIFSSQDGYPFVNLSPDKKSRWPKFTRDIPEAEMPKCSIEYKQCFTDANGHPFTSASEVFKHIAFNNPQCGDCAIVALVSASGDLGLEAFLPSPKRTISPSLHDDAAVPHLPLTDTWAAGRFALRDVVAGPQRTAVRDWTLRLLQRYRFVIGETPSHFAMLSGPSAFRTMVTRLQKKPETALLCVNDDIAIDDDKVGVQFKAWAEERWGTRARWER